ncbi:MAG: alpha/beta hydrolase [Hyphomicrobiales bacterium]|nr:MAG: alpha/beta hydrolase [Hyphomicrobiales bacterium]
MTVHARLPHNAFMAITLKVLAGLVAAYVLVVFAGYMLQRRLMYFPTPERVTPAQAGLPGVEERVLKMPDGVRVIAWYAKAQPGKPTLLYFHGNAGSLGGRAHRIQAYRELGWGVFMMSYRGYSGSGGSPTEKDNVADARIAYGALLLEGVDAGDVVIYGESLGSGVAARLATERKAAGLVLEAPYTSIVDMAKLAYPYLPAQWFLTDRYETDKVLPQVHMPLLILHGAQDGLIPIRMGEALLEIANPPKTLVAFPDGAHSNLYSPGRDAQIKVRDWFAALKDSRKDG